MNSPELPPESINDPLSAKARLRMEVIQSLVESRGYKNYGDRVEAAAEKLDCSVRTVQRLVKKWEAEGLAAFAQDGRRDNGTHWISADWQNFIVDAYNNGKCTPAQVAAQVRAKAEAEGQDYYPSRMAVYRVLAPRIKKKE